MKGNKDTKKQNKEKSNDKKQEESDSQNKKKIEDLMKKTQCNNKYDTYRLKSSLDEFVIEYMERKYKIKEDNRFSNIRISLGSIACITLVTSHFNPYPWPDQYYLVLACVVIYTVVTQIMSYYESKYECNSILLFTSDLFKQSHLNQKLIRISSNVQPYSHLYTFTIQDYNHQSFKVSQDLHFNHYIDEEGFLCQENLYKKLEELFDQFDAVIRQKKQ